MCPDLIQKSQLAATNKGQEYQIVSYIAILLLTSLMYTHRKKAMIKSAI